MAAFTLATELRAANVAGLQWTQVDLVRRVAWVHADQAKAGKALPVPLNSEAVVLIRKWLAAIDRGCAHTIDCCNGRVNAKVEPVPT